MDCTAHGDPLPTIDWQKERVEVVSNEINERISILSNHSLMIVAAQLTDEGRYSCVVSNQLGRLLKDVIIKIQSESDPTHSHLPIDFTTALLGTVGSDLCLFFH